MIRRLAALAVTCLALVVPSGAPEAAAPVRIWPLGDSIVYGTAYRVNATTVQPWPGGWRGGLDALLTARGVAHQFVGTRTDNSTPVLDRTNQQRHDGWPGINTYEVAASLDGPNPSPYGGYGRWMTGVPTRAAVVPDLVVIHLGANDISRLPHGDYDDPAIRAAVVSTTATRLAELVDKLQLLRPGVRIVVSTPVPIVPGDNTDGAHLVMPEYAPAVRAVVAAEQARSEQVVLADVYAAFTVDDVPIPGLVSPDNYHPLPSGYALMSTIYADAVQAALSL